jgi:hypothetical protein
MKKMQIFEPAMCCSTGLCGVGVDPELLRISTTLNSLEKNGIKIERFNLSSAPQEFVNNKKVNDFLKEKGVEGLPIVLVEEEIVISGRYPNKEEFVQIFAIPANYILEKPKTVRASFKTTVKKSEGCGCSGGDCC